MPEHSFALMHDVDGESAEVETLQTKSSNINIIINSSSLQQEQQVLEEEEGEEDQQHTEEFQHRDDDNDGVSDVTVVCSVSKRRLDSPPSLAAATNGSSVSGRGNETEEEDISPRSIICTSLPNTEQEKVLENTQCMTLYYMRMDDLHLDTHGSFKGQAAAPAEEKTRNYHLRAPPPPPSDVCSKTAELPLYVGLDTLVITPNKQHTYPSIHLTSVTKSLVELGLRMAFHCDECWTPHDSKTMAFTKLEKERRRALREGRTTTIHAKKGGGPMGKKSKSSSWWSSPKSSNSSSSSYSYNSKMDEQVMLWTGDLPLPLLGCTADKHSTTNAQKKTTKQRRASLYGYDIPAVKARGILPMSPKDAALLLLDSSRVHEYNKSSKGRTEDVIFSDGLDDGGGGVAKIVRSRAKPPLIPATLEFVSLLHGRALLEEEERGCDGESGREASYIVVSRAVTKTLQAAPPSSSKLPANEEEDGDVIRGEVMLNVHIVRPVPGATKSQQGNNHHHRCEMININHLKSPSVVPNFIAKKIGLSAAVNFIQDLRALGKKA